MNEGRKVVYQYREAHGSSGWLRDYGKHRHKQDTDKHPVNPHATYDRTYA
jgi:hypothetical protein